MATVPFEPIYIAADMALSWEGAKGGGSYLNAATVTWTLTTYTGTSVSTGSLSYTTASNGDYTGTIPSSVTSGLTLDSAYYLYLAFSQGGFDDERRIPCKAVYRRDQ